MDDNIFKNNFFKDLWRFLTNRLLLLAVIILLLFYFLAATIFDLQIVNGQNYIRAVTATYNETLTLTSPRGTIYDRFGRPLALNSTAYSVKIDPSSVAPNSNEMLHELIVLFEENEQQYVDDFPITLHEPYAFEWSVNRETNWKKNMNVPEELSAYETVEYLREHFKIGPELSALEARKLLSLRSLLYLQRFAQYNTVTVAYNANMKTMIALEERRRDFSGVFIDVESLREYPNGRYVSHIIGYIGRISEDDYNANKENGYTNNSMFGRSGIERAFESELRGIDGERVVETNNLGTILRTLEVTPPTQGNKVFLTIDSVFQEKLYYMLEDHLRDTIKNKMIGHNAREKPITVREFFISMVNANNISLRDILESEQGSDSYTVREFILSVHPEASVSQKGEDERNAAIRVVKDIIADGITRGTVRPVTMLLVMLEQGIITGDEQYIQQLKNGRITPLQAIIDKLNSKEITPQMTNLDPSTGSVVVLDVRTGGVIGAVGYPTFDNNELVNHFNNEYYQKLLRDPTTPLRNRPFMEARAPGSSFKMISAVAALESGEITPRSTIYDGVAFTKAGRPHTRCHSGYSHGSINIVSALAVSCNYFFCEAIYRLGTERSGGMGRDALMRYMTEFGLNDRTGVEIYERADEIRASMVGRGWPENTPIISSPQYKEFSMKLFNPDVPPSEFTWFDGDTVRTSIGQANNQYSAVAMAKYVATLATGGVRYQTHLLDRITTQHDEPVREFGRVTEHVIDFAPETLDTVFRGMLAVTETPQGTAYATYKNFPVRVAGKTGTAQESSSRNDHSSFAAFAPYEEPEIAVYVQLPFGDTRYMPRSAAELAKQVIAEYMGFNVEPQYAEETNALAQ